MGEFSWFKADILTNVANIVKGKPFKFLIPIEFGGGYIEDFYQGYGYLDVKESGQPKYDMLELLAFWNCNSDICSKLHYNNKLFPLMKEIDEYTENNRLIGIKLELISTICKIDLKYPLKLVSYSYKGTYETCLGKSYSDPNQGLHPFYRNNKNYLQCPFTGDFCKEKEICSNCLLNRKGDAK